jgi:hypothetical protein
MLFHDLLAFRVSVEKFAVILFSLPLYVTCLLSFAAFRILYLFCVMSILIMMCLGYLFFGLDGLVFCKLPAPG